MRRAVKALFLVAALAAGITFALPGNADAGYRFRHGFHGHGFHGFYGHGFYGRGFYGRGFYGRGFYGPYYGARPIIYSGAVRIEVEPKGARDEMVVYVDEGRAGVVDNFDGAFQRLYLPPGKHEIEVRLDGYEPLRQTVFVTAGKTFNLRGTLQPVSAE